MKSYPHLWSRLYGTPLLVHPEKAAVIDAVFRERLGQIDRGAVVEASYPSDEAAVQAWSAKCSARAAIHAGIRYRSGTNKPYLLTESGIAVIPVIGTLIHRGDWIDAMSGFLSYGRIQSLAERANDDYDVRATMLEIDSYGGEAAGLFDLCTELAKMGQQKPLWAHLNEEAYSAAYAVACSASQILMPPTGSSGSIGTIMLFVDQSKRDAQQGYVYEYIYAGARKNDFNPHAPLSDEARTIAQAEVDRLYGFFVRHVAASRDVSEESVRATEAGVFDPEFGIAEGYIDGTASFGEAIGLLEAELAVTPFSSGARAARLSTRKENSMEPKDKPAAEQPKPPAQPAAQQPADVTAEATKVAADARQAERARIAAITTCDEAKGRAKLAHHLAHETEMSADDAKKVLAASAADPGDANPLASAMAGVKNPKVGTDTEADETATKGRIDSAAIYAARRPKALQQ